MTTETTISYVPQVPWAGVGAQDGDDPDRLYATAGLDYEVEEKHIWFGGVNNEAVRIPRQKVLVRSDTGLPLAIMGEGYQVTQNSRLLDLAKGLSETGKARIISAGTINEGRRVFMLCELPGEVRIGQTDDIVKKHLLLANAHDGSLSTHVAATPLRMWCANMVPAALAGSALRVSIRHTASSEDRLEEAAGLVGQAVRQYNSFGIMANALAQTKFSERDMKKLAEALFPAKGEKATANVVQYREKVLDLYENGHGQHLVRGSAWAALNAVTEFTDHYRMTRVAGNTQRDRDESKVREARLDSVWFGKSARLKQDALVRIVRDTGLKFAA